MNRFKKDIICLIAVIVLGVTCYMAWLNHVEFEKTIISQAQEQLLIIAKSEAQSIEEYFLDIRKELEKLSSEFAVRQALSEDKYKNIKAAYLVVMEDSYKEISKLVDSIYLIDSKGIVVSASPFKNNVVGQDFSRVVDVEAILSGRQPYSSEMFKTASGFHAIANLQPVFESGKFIGVLRAAVLVDRINNLVNHINREGKGFAIVLDRNATLLSYPQPQYIGINVMTLLNGKFPKANFTGSEALINKMCLGQEGKGIINFLSATDQSQPAKALVAFTPVHVDGGTWSIAVTMDYDVITLPINKNVRDNLIFTGFIFLTCIAIGITFYRIQKKKAELSISESVLNIINKQLHLEIEQRKQLEKELHKGPNRAAKEETK